MRRILRRLWKEENGLLGWVAAAAVVLTLAAGYATYKAGQFVYSSWVGPASQGSTGGSMHYDDQGFPIIVQPVKAVPKPAAKPADNSSSGSDSNTTVVQSQPAAPAPADPGGPVIVVSGNGGTDDSNSSSGGGTSSSSSSSSSSSNGCTHQSMFWASGDMGGGGSGC